jgi:hypothetical protein
LPSLPVPNVSRMSSVQLVRRQASQSRTLKSRDPILSWVTSKTFSPPSLSVVAYPGTTLVELAGSVQGRRLLKFGDQLKEE